MCGNHGRGIERGRFLDGSIVAAGGVSEETNPSSVIALSKAAIDIGMGVGSRTSRCVLVNQVDAGACVRSTGAESNAADVPEL